MPDRWGRVSPEDIMGMANQAMGLYNSLQGIHDFRAKQQHKKDIKSSYGFIQGESDKGSSFLEIKKPESISPEAWGEALGLYTGQQGALNKLDNMKKGKETKKLINNYLSKPDLILNENKFMKEEASKGMPAHEARAYALNLLSKTEKGAALVNEIRFESALNRYQNEISPLINHTKKLVSSGDLVSAAPFVKEVSKKMGMGVELTDFDPKSGYFQRVEHTPQGTKEMSPFHLKDAISYINEISGKTYATQMAHLAQRASDSNLKAEFEKFSSPDGKQYYVKPVKEPLNPHSEDFIVIPKVGKGQHILKSVEELFQSGLRPFKRGGLLGNILIHNKPKENIASSGGFWGKAFKQIHKNRVSEPFVAVGDLSMMFQDKLGHEENPVRKLSSSEQVVTGNVNQTAQPSGNPQIQYRNQTRLSPYGFREL